MMKINVSNILLSIVIVILLFNILKKNNVPEPQKIEVVIPEYSGSTGEIKVVDSFIPIKIPSPYKITETIQVDKGYKDLYEKAMRENDSLKQYNLFLESIKITEKDIKLVDNDTLKASIKTKNRGELLSYDFKWNINEKRFEYKPKTVSESPKLQVGLGFEASPPNKFGDKLLGKFDFDIHFKNNNTINISPDLDGRIWFGYSRRFTIIK